MHMSETHKCTSCGLELPRDSFSPNRDKLNGLQSWCKSCKNKRAAQTRRNKYSHMIKTDALMGLLDSLTYCGICGKSGPLVVDHCHQTNIFRGLLCAQCNFGLGNFKDDPSLLETARLYLLAHHEPGWLTRLMALLVHVTAGNSKEQQ